jgi:hypothetical protein
MKKLTIFAGAERSGKTFLAETIGMHYVKKGHSFVVYNAGGKDFTNYERLSILNPVESYEYIKKEEIKRLKLNPRIIHFKFQNKVYNIKDLNKIIKGKKVVIPRMWDSENLLWITFYYYLSNSFLLIDDSRSVFRRLPTQAIALFSRKNHTGEHSSIESFRARS